MSEVVKDFKSSVEKSINFYKEELKGEQAGQVLLCLKILRLITMAHLLH